MPIPPTPIEHIKRSVVKGARLLISSPALILLGLLAWGVRLVDDHIDSLTFVTTIVSWLLAAGFFGVAAGLRSPKPPSPWKLIWPSIRKFTVGIVVITMVFSLPVLLIVPVVNEALSLGLEGSTWVLILFVGPTVVPSIAAMWSLTWRHSGLAQAAADGILMLKGKWIPALILGAAYQALALGSKSLRLMILEHDATLTVLAGIPWVAVEVLFRLALFMWLYEDAPNTPKPSAAGQKA